MGDLLKFILLPFLFTVLTDTMGQTYSITVLSCIDNKPVCVEISNGIIVSVKPANLDNSPEDSLYIGPGLIDNQVNGFAGVSFGFIENNISLEGLQHVTRELWKRGITTYLPTLTTNTTEKVSV